MIGIVDYGMGNLRSVQKAFEYLGFPAEITADPDRLGRMDHVVLPGVGAFSDAIARLKQDGLDEAVRTAAERGVPLLGICLGMQLMFEHSEENGYFDGLGFFPGTIARLNAPGLKVPHMGWNTLETRACPLWDAGARPAVYFVHSYRAPLSEAYTCAACEYGETFSAAVCRENIVATQFHPCKSGAAGLEMLRRFALFG